MLIKFAEVNMCYGTEMIQKCVKGLVFMLLFTISLFGSYVIIQERDRFESVN